LKIAKYTREIALGIILGCTIIIQYLHIHSGVMYPSVHAICPLGGLENLWAWVGGQANLQKLFSGTLTLFFFTLAFALVFGRAFCGNICPFGALQEFVGKIWKRKLEVPEKADRVLRLFKYPILIFITAMAWITATIWIAPYDPWAAFAHIWTGSELFAEMRIGAAVLVVVLAASIFVDRFFCKYLCPAGALYGIISKISFYKIKRENCQSCGQCTKICPMDIEINKANIARSSECIACGQCITVCPPENNAIKMTVFYKNVKPVAFTLLVLALFFGSLLIFNAAGIYQVTVPTISEVQESGNYLKIVDLRGSMSIEVGSFYAGMDLSDFYELMEIPETVPKETWLKDVVYYVPGYDFHVMKANKTK
jgi:polyferredoxin